MLNASVLKEHTDNIVAQKRKTSLEAIENVITNAANNGRYECDFEDRIADDLIAVLENLGYVVECKFDSIEQTFYTVISWGNT